MSSWHTRRSASMHELSNRAPFCCEVALARKLVSADTPWMFRPCFYHFGNESSTKAVKRLDCAIEVLINIFGRMHRLRDRQYDMSSCCPSRPVLILPV